ncbi:S1C family serine protease [Polymorphobacter arshaanensis]|nr:trypsin-like peptidase domain-containing protein [Polymorphobacter arshaanensis]
MRSEISPLFKVSVAVVALAGSALAGAQYADRLPWHASPAITPPARTSQVAALVAPAVKGGSLADMVAAVGPSVVQIVVKPTGGFHPMQFEGQPGEAPSQGGLGSGFIVDAKGIVVTNNHVVGDAQTVTVQLSDGRELSGRVLGRDKQTDLAVVQIEGSGDFTPVAWGDSDHTRVGDPIFAVGSPFGLGSTVTSGIISARGREIGAGPYDDFLQVDAAINSGNSGGPLFDASGRVIGVNTAIFSPSGGNVGIGFAIPAQMAHRVVEQIVANGHVARGRIGVALQAVTPDIARAIGAPDTKGALIAQVDPNGTAAQAELQSGDIVRSFGGQPVDDSRDLARLVADAKAGTTVRVAIVRRGQLMDVQLRVGGEQQA